MKTILAWIVLWLLIVILVMGCDAGIATLKGPGPALHLLQNEGFAHPKVVHRDIWYVPLRGCGRDDIVAYDIQAVNPRGQTVIMRVCEGIFKGATPRG